MPRPLSALCGVLALLVVSAVPVSSTFRTVARSGSGAAILEDAWLFDAAFAGTVRFDAPDGRTLKLGYPVVGSRRPALDEIVAFYGAPDTVAREQAAMVPSGFDAKHWPRATKLPEWPWREIDVCYYGDVGFGVVDGRIAWVTNRSPVAFRGAVAEPERSEPATKLALGQYDGNWDEGPGIGSFSFTVVNGTVSAAGMADLGFGQCSDGGTIYEAYARPISIEGAKLDVTVSGVTNDNIWIVTNTGTFSSDSAISGSRDFLIVGNCGFLFGFGSFTARKQPDYVLSVRPPYQRIFSGQSTSFDVAVDPLGGFNQPVDVEIAVPSVEGVTVSPLSATIAPGDRVTIDVMTEPGISSIGIGALVTSRTGSATHVTQGGVESRLFLLDLDPERRAVTPGQSATFTLTRESPTFAEPATLSADVFPQSSDVRVSFGKGTLAAGEQTTVTVTTAPGTEVDTYSITIVGTADGREEAASATLDVTNAGFTIALDPATLTLAPKGKGTVVVNVNRVGSFSGPVTVSAANAKTIGMKVKPGSIVVSGSSATFQVKAKKGAQPGPYEIVFTGRDNQGNKRTASLVVTVP